MQPETPKRVKRASHFTLGVHLVVPPLWVSIRDAQLTMFGLILQECNQLNNNTRDQKVLGCLETSKLACRQYPSLWRGSSFYRVLPGRRSREGGSRHPWNVRPYSVGPTSLLRSCRYYLAGNRDTKTCVWQYVRHLWF